MIGFQCSNTTVVVSLRPPQTKFIEQLPAGTHQDRMDHHLSLSHSQEVVKVETGLELEIEVEIEASLSNTTDSTGTATATTASTDSSSRYNSSGNHGTVNSDSKAIPKTKNKKRRPILSLSAQQLLLLPLSQRYASSIARHPAKHLVVALLLSTTLSIIVFTKGNLHLDAPNVGWFTKGTLIANRAAQEEIIQRAAEGEIIARELMGAQHKYYDERERRDEELYCSGSWYGSSKMLDPDEINMVSVRKIMGVNSALDADALYEMCISEEHTLDVLSENDLCHKCAVENELSWDDDSTKDQERCIQPYSLVRLARLYMRSKSGFFELGTEHLVPSVSCDGLKRFWTTTVQRKFEEILLECTQSMLEKTQLKPATNADYSLCDDFPMMTASLVDDQFVETGRVQYTSSIFATKNDPSSVKAMYLADKENRFRSSPIGKYSLFEQELHDVGMNTLYATAEQGFYEIYLNDRLPIDVAISAASLVIAGLCVLVHTASPFLTILGLVQILLALPMGYFVYYFVCGITFFPFLNVNAIFILFAVGADDIFVAVDKWSAMRRELPQDFTTEQVASYALPKIAFATFVTSITTAAAFFASSGVNVPIIASFVIFCGLLVTMDYVLSIVILFPAICMHDRWLAQGCRSRWLRLSPTKSWKTEVQSRVNDDEERHVCRECATNVEDAETIECLVSDECSMIEAIEVMDNSCPKEASAYPAKEYVGTAAEVRAPPLQRSQENDTNVDSSDNRTFILSSYYNLLHFLRWPILLLALAAIIICSFVASGIESPNQISPPILPSTNRYEKHRLWSEHLLASKLIGSREVLFIWGSTPTDTSRRLDPSQSSALVLDTSFEPSNESVQVYLLEKCNDLKNDKNDTLFRTQTQCLFQEFNDWLVRQSQSASPAESYIESCPGASGIPTPSEIFHPCLIAYSNLYESKGVLHDEGIVRVIALAAKTHTSYQSLVEDQGREWEALEQWSEHERELAPEGASNFYFSSFNFHVYDTLKNIVSSARSSIGIAIACVTATVLLTSRSFTVTILSVISIGYVFVSTAACLVGLGWTMGLFESVLFSVSIGIGSDYILHASHTYSMAPDILVSRKERTRYAILHIGPSIIGSAFTTLSTSIIMMFTENEFYRKFGTMLIVTILQALIGSFVVFFGLSIV